VEAVVNEPPKIDWDAWKPEEPSPRFADDVMARIGRERRPRRWPLVVGGGAIALAAAVVLVPKLGTPREGAAIASERLEVPLGRAVAVLEPGASLRWRGDDVEQARGDVFYRVDPGARRFVVHTPAGDVEVKGTCFTVRVRTKEEEGTVQRSNILSAAAGAAATALAFVVVHEGRVAIARAGDRVELTAGESGKAGPNGVAKAGPDAAKAFAAEAAILEDPTASANQNLVRQIGEYRARLEAVSAQKTELEAKLKRSEEVYAAKHDGQPAPKKDDYDLSPDDWRDLAKDGSIKYRLPCIDKPGRTFEPSRSQLDALGLAQEDAAPIKEAYAAVGKEVWAAVKPLCAQVLGSAEVADKVGPDTCVHLVSSSETEKDAAAALAAKKLVGEIRAGLRPMPGPNDPVHPVAKLFLATTGAHASFESKLAQAFGPEEARRIASSGELCENRSFFREGPPRPKN